tara:strand:- start:414 stop:1073 length:660 start_codon:yes stop_codon:yes gene_type:complete
MKRMLRYLSIILVILIFNTKSSAENLEVFKFTKDEFNELEVRKIRGADSKTTYSLDTNKNGNYLKAEASGGASGLGKELKINLIKTPYLNITWKVEKDLAGIDEKSKKGHDFAARVFVVKKTGLTPLSNKAINYVFSSNNNINEYWRSPYTKSSIDYVLSTTKENLNEWVTVKANVKDHFKKLHGLDVENITGIALMTDTDQSKKPAIAYYQNIYFSSN